MSGWAQRGSVRHRLHRAQQPTLQRWLPRCAHKHFAGQAWRWQAGSAGLLHLCVHAPERLKQGFKGYVVASWSLRDSSVCLGYTFSRALYRSRGSTGRSAGYPMGWERAATINANYMVSRLVLMLFICAAKKLFYVVEQPSGSLLQLHTAFQKFCKRVRIWRKFVSMEDFGAGSEKGTWLYSGAMAH